MNGTILDYDAREGGVLRGADGRRYAFASVEWKSATPPAVGAAVDFEPDGDVARSLYAVPKSAPPPVVAGPGTFFGGRPGLPLAVLLLIACFLPFLTLGPLSANMFNLVGVASTAGRYASRVNMETGLWLFHGLYVVPLIALVLIVQEWRGRAGPWLRIGTGLVGLIAPVAITLGARAMFTPVADRASLVRRLLRRAREFVDLDMFVPHVGIGWIAIGLLSLALIAVGLFWGSPGKTRGDAAV
ncbi:MAG TPA: hypothetical protein VGO55_01790 [Allosphingosinicella sp.]|jgi:hypothetical protein|nr:hypothetical protein [Allosphingosinicella sp.]